MLLLLAGNPDSGWTTKPTVANEVSARWRIGFTCLDGNDVFGWVRYLSVQILPTPSSDHFERSMTARPISASETQQRIVTALRPYRDLRCAPDDVLSDLLNQFAVSPKEMNAATSAIYAEAYYRCAKDGQISENQTVQLDRLASLLRLTDEQVISITYRVGLAIYKKRFREAVADGDLSESEDHLLKTIQSTFGLRKRDLQKAISQQALAYYSFRLTDALRDGVLSDDEMADLALIANKLGLTSRQMKAITVPNKKEILATALSAIKSRGDIRSEDRDHIRQLAEYLNAKDDLLKPCLMDLDLYERIFAIRAGELPTVDDKKIILDRGDQLHYVIPVTYEVPRAGKIVRRTGTLYVSSRRIRFVGLRRSHEIRYSNLLRVDFTHQKNSKITVVVASGAGGGVYRLKNHRDPGLLVELQ